MKNFLLKSPIKTEEVKLEIVEKKLRINSTC